MTKVKQHIMEVLMRAENGLSNEEISWAIKNIPNDDAPGIVPGDPVVYNHQHDNIFDACGITDEVADRIQEEYKEIRLSAPKGSRSMFVQSLVNNGSPDLIRSLIIRGIQSIETQRQIRESGIGDVHSIGGGIGIGVPKEKILGLLEKLGDDITDELKRRSEESSEKPKQKDDFQRKLQDFLRKLKGGS